MAETFTPEDIKACGPEGLQYSDVYGLTCDQMQTTLSELLGVRPNARITRNDLIGYHFIQYGMGEEFISGAIDLAKGGSWQRWDPAIKLR